ANSLGGVGRVAVGLLPDAKTPTLPDGRSYVGAALDLAERADGRHGGGRGRWGRGRAASAQEHNEA
ncbi:MAG: hypothetical protein ACE1ZU_07665, partial [bacterium]